MSVTPGECWEIWQQEVGAPPTLVCVHLQDSPEEPLYGVLDMSRPRSLACRDCAMAWSNWVMPGLCGCCGANVGADPVMLRLPVAVRVSFGWRAPASPTHEVVLAPG